MVRVFLKVGYPEGYPPLDCHSALIHCYQQWMICDEGEADTSILVRENALPTGSAFSLWARVPPDIFSGR